MTVTTTAAQSGPFTPNSITTTFALGFHAMTAEEVRVWHIISGAQVDITTGFSITGLPGAGTLVFDTAPVTGSGLIYAAQAPSMTQDDEFANQGAFLPQVVERALDKLVVADQHLNLKIDQLTVTAAEDAAELLTPAAIALIEAAADTAKDDALEAIGDAGTEALGDLSAAAALILTEPTGTLPVARDDALADITTGGNDQVALIAAAGSAQRALVANAVNNGVFPTTTNALSNGGSGISFVAGSGYTPGTYDSVLTGGGGSNMAVRFHVSAGGAIDQAYFLSKGYGYATAPAAALTGAGGGSGGSITITIAPRNVLGDYFETPSTTGFGGLDLWRVTAGPAATNSTPANVPTQLALTLERMAGVIPSVTLIEASVADATADPVPYIPNRKATHSVYTGENQEYGPPVLLAGWVRVGSGTRVWGQTDSLGGQRGCLLTITGTDYFWRGNSCAAGTWKMGMRAHTLAGTATVNLGAIGDTTNTVTFGTTSSDQEVTFTKGGTWNPQVAGPCALVIEELWIAPSTATVAYPVPDGHFYFGASADTVRRPAKAGVSQVTIGANSQGWMALNAPVSANDFTVLAVVSQTGAIAGLSGILSAWPDATIMNLSINGNKLTMYKGGAALSPRHSIDINGTGPRMVGMSYSTRRAGASLFLDDIEIEFQQQAVDPGRMLQEFCVGMLDQTSSRFVGDITPPEFWSRALSYEEIRRYFDVKKRRMALDGKSLFDPLNVAIFEGDSITGLPYTYVNSMTAALLAAGIQPVKFAWPSDGLQHLYDRSARVDAVVKPGRRTNLFLGPFAGNDFGGVGGLPVYSSIATWEDDFKVYLDRRYKAGVNRIDIITATPTTNANNTAAYDTLMAWYVANEGRYFDRVIPLRGSNPLGLNARATNVSYYADGTHPNAPSEMDLIGAFVLPYVLDAFKGPTAMHVGNYIPSVHPPITW